MDSMRCVNVRLQAQRTVCAVMFRPKGENFLFKTVRQRVLHTLLRLGGWGVGRDGGRWLLLHSFPVGTSCLAHSRVSIILSHKHIHGERSAVSCGRKRSKKGSRSFILTPPFFFSKSHHKVQFPHQSLQYVWWWWSFPPLTLRRAPYPRIFGSAVHGCFSGSLPHTQTLTHSRFWWRRIQRAFVLYNRIVSHAFYARLCHLFVCLPILF